MCSLQFAIAMTSCFYCSHRFRHSGRTRCDACGVPSVVLRNASLCDSDTTCKTRLQCRGNWNEKISAVARPSNPGLNSAYSSVQSGTFARHRYQLNFFLQHWLAIWAGKNFGKLGVNTDNNRQAQIESRIQPRADSFTQQKHLWPTKFASILSQSQPRYSCGRA